MADSVCAQDEEANGAAEKAHGRPPVYQPLSQPVRRVIEEINPILRGWVNYFAVGHSSQCFSFIRLWVEKKVRRHLMRARGRQGSGWKRWSTKWLHDKLGIFNDYRVSRQQTRNMLFVVCEKSSSVCFLGSCLES
jgi:hypothetical protein